MSARPATCPPSWKAGVLVLEVVLLMAFAAPIWANRVDQFPSGPDVTHLRAVGQQFQWDLQYAGPDGKLGHRSVNLVTGSNPLGLDRNDPDAADDLTTVGEMHLPVNKPCIVDVMSRDVIHDFCIPNMRVAQDAIPGSIIPLWFIPVKTGTYEIVCAQLCGNQHSAMKGTLIVESEADYKSGIRVRWTLSIPRPTRRLHLLLHLIPASWQITKSTADPYPRSTPSAPSVGTTENRFSRAQNGTSFSRPTLINSRPAMQPSKVSVNSCRTE